MPFRLSNAPASFQGYINKIMAKKLDIFVIVYLDDILIYTEDQGREHMEVVQWVLDILRKNDLFANLKKCQFYKDKVRFLRYVVLSQGIRMEDERIKVIRNWPELKSVQDIQVFIGFANFYQRFIQGFSKIVAPLTSMLKTTGSSDLAQRDDDDEVVGGGGDRNLSKSKKSKNAKSGIQTRIGATGEPTFLTPGAREAFNQLRQAFTEAPILRHFDPECHIRIETDASGYAIGGVLSQLISDHLTSDQGQWHPVAYFLRKMIPTETGYKIYDSELLVNVEAFKAWRHYLKGCKHKVRVLTNNNNLYWFMDTKNLSSKQVRWAQKLSRYHFQIDYCQGKANGAADALSRFPQRNQAKEDELRTENTRILHKLQSSLTNASLSGLNTSAELSPLHRVLICGTHVLPQLRQFWDTFRAELGAESPYRVSIGAMRLRLSEL